MRGRRGGKGGNTTSHQHPHPQAAGDEEELLPGVDVLLEVFPTCSVEQAQWVLAKTRGDLEEAVQMLVEGKEGPPGWDGPNQVFSAGACPHLCSPIATPPWCQAPAPSWPVPMASYQCHLA